MRGTLPERLDAWFAARGWSPHPHQLAMLAEARAGRLADKREPCGRIRREQRHGLRRARMFPASHSALWFCHCPERVGSRTIVRFGPRGGAMARDEHQPASGRFGAMVAPGAPRVPGLRLALLASLFVAVPMLTASATTAERVFAAVSPSVVVVEGAAQGSGVVVAPRLVATNCHVVDEAPQIMVRRGRIGHAATPVRADVARDVCLLEVPTLEAPAVTLGEAARLRVGAPVYAVGAPAALELSLSAGIVSQLRSAEGGPVVQTTAAVSPGSSGGGLFDERGRLVGLTTFQLGRGQNLNFAVPAEWVAAALAGHAAWRRCRTAPDAPCLMAEALATARGITHPTSRASALSRIAATQRQAGDRHESTQTLAEALATARGIGDPAWLAPALLGVAEAQAEAGNTQEVGRLITEALAATRGTDDAFQRTVWLFGIARVQRLVGDIAGALATARAIGDTLGRDITLSDIADAQVRAGDTPGALTTARGIGDAGRRERVLSTVALAKAQAGNVRAALAVAREIGDAGWRALAFYNIAVAQAKAGDIAGALARARGIGDPFWREAAIAGIADNQAQAGDFRGALGTARGVRHASVRASALASIGRIQAQRGDRQNAERTFAESLAAARGIGDASSRAGTLADIAQAQAQGGDRQEAARTLVEAVAAARGLWGDASLQALWLADVAAVQAQVGDISGALATTRMIDDSFGRADALTRIAARQAQAGDRHGSGRTFAEALVTARGLGDSRTDALTRIAEAQAQASDITGAVETIETLREPYRRAAQFASLARHLAVGR